MGGFDFDEICDSCGCLKSDDDTGKHTAKKCAKNMKRDLDDMGLL